MSDIEVTQPGVLKLLASLDPKKSTGPDQLVAPRILKEVSSEVTPVLPTSSTSHYLQAIVPVDWKLCRKLQTNFTHISMLELGKIDSNRFGLANRIGIFRFGAV